jgi:hypothetical protein
MKRPQIVNLELEDIGHLRTADYVEQLERENAELLNKISEYEKFMSCRVCYTVDELVEKEHGQILRLAYELRSAFPHHTGVYYWLTGCADELIQNKNVGGE